MHELSLCRSIASVVTEHAGGRSVDLIHLRIGHLRQVVPDTLVASWELVSRHTPLEGSSLEIEHVPAVLACRECGTDTTVTVPVFRCGCGSTDVEVTSGQEFLVTSLELQGA